jgi:hypothetical protein
MLMIDEWNDFQQRDSLFVFDVLDLPRRSLLSVGQLPLTSSRKISVMSIYYYYFTLQKWSYFTVNPTTTSCRVDPAGC